MQKKNPLNRIENRFPFIWCIENERWKEKCFEFFTYIFFHTQQHKQFYCLFISVHSVDNLRSGGVECNFGLLQMLMKFMQQCIPFIILRIRWLEYSKRNLLLLSRIYLKYWELFIAKCHDHLTFCICSLCCWYWLWLSLLLLQSL